MWWEREKTRNFGLSTLRGPPLRVPTSREPPFGTPPFRAPLFWFGALTSQKKPFLFYPGFHFCFCPHVLFVPFVFFTKKMSRMSFFCPVCVFCPGMHFSILSRFVFLSRFTSGTQDPSLLGSAGEKGGGSQLHQFIPKGNFDVKMMTFLRFNDGVTPHERTRAQLDIQQSLSRTPVRIKGNFVKLLRTRDLGTKHRRFFSAPCARTAALRGKNVFSNGSPRRFAFQ